MYRTPVLLMATLALSAFGCAKAGEEADTNGAAVIGEIAPNIYDGQRAVLQVTDLPNGNQLYSFAHTLDKAGGATEIIKGAVEVKRGETPKLAADEIYPCSVSVSAEAGNVIATGRCRGRDRDFRVTLAPRKHADLVGTFAADATFVNGVAVTVGNASATGLDVSIANGGLATTKADSGEWIYGGGAYRANFGKCTITVVTRSAEKELILDVGSANKAIDLDVRGLECGKLKATPARPMRLNRR